VLYGGPPRDGKCFYQATDISAGCVGCGLAGCNGGLGVLNDEEDWVLWHAVAGATCPPADGELKNTMAGGLWVFKGEGLLPVCESAEAGMWGWRGGPWRCYGWGNERRGFSEEYWQLAAAGINALGLKGIHYGEFGRFLLMAAWVQYLFWCFLSNPCRNLYVLPLNMMIRSPLISALPACIVVK
jgi:hypothetical protein